MINHNDDIYELNDSATLDLFEQNEYARAFNEVFQEIDNFCKYFDEQSFITSFQNYENFLCVSINMRSLGANFTNLKCFLDELKAKNIFPSCIALQEVWRVDLSLFNISEYSLVGRTRTTGQGGGCAWYISNKFIYKQISCPNHFEENILESFCIQVECPSKRKLLLNCVYRPPSNPILTQSEHNNKFFEGIANQLEFLSDLNLPCYFLGDFNLNLFQHNSVTSEFIDLFASYGFINIITKATHFNNESATLLDHIFTNDKLNVLDKFGVIIDGIADHCMPFFSLKQVEKNTSKKIVYVRNMSRENHLSFFESLSELDWQDILNIDCPNLACNTFLDQFFNLFNFHFPYKRVKNNKKTKPLNEFMSKGLLVSRKRKLKLARVAKLRPTIGNKDRYRTYRNLYNKHLKKAKKLHFNRKIKSAGLNCKKIWDVIKEATNLKSGKNNSLDTLLINDILVSDSQKIADHLNIHFSTIGDRVVEEIPRSNIDFRQFLPPPCARSIFLSPISVETMQNSICSIVPKSSKDINDVSMKLLHQAAPLICTPLAHIFNLTLTSGKFPDRLKTSKVIPVFKTGNKMDANNYRGISLIDNFGKIFEKIMSNKILDFLESENFFFKYQFGFRKNHSTNMAILSILNYVTESINNGKYAVLITLDIKKCFDVISHDILLSKLENAGIRGVALEWFRSYLTNREQKVFIDGVFSNNSCKITRSVFQGSILGVILFLIFINDLPNCSDLIFSPIFADDNNALLSHSDINRLLEIANIELDKVVKWYTCNKLLINPDKTRYMIFHPPHLDTGLPLVNGQPYFPLFINLNSYDETDISKVSLIKGVPNESEGTIKILGILFDKKLSFKQHVNYVHGKLSRSIYSLRQMKNILDNKNLKLMYFAYIQSHLNYCVNIFSMCTAETINPLIKLQKKAIRIISGSAYNAHSAPIFKNENILPFKQLIDYEILKFMFCFKNGKLPIAFSDVWIENIEVNNYQLRNSHDYVIPRVRYLYLFSHPLYLFPRKWNELRNDLKQSQTIKEFSKKIKLHLLSLIT